MKPRVLITRQLPEAAVEAVRRDCEVDLDPLDRHLTPEALCQAVHDKAGIIALVTDAIDAKVFEAAPSLQVVANVAVGYDNIDVAAATQRGVVVTNTPGILTETSADLSWGLLLSIARRIPEADRYIRAGRWTEWKLMVMLGHDIYAQTLGIIGMGRIGQAVARRARGCGMRIIYHNRQRVDPAIEAELEATWVELSTLLRDADFVSLHVPLSAATTRLIGEAELRLMKPTAYLINTGAWYDCRRAGVDSRAPRGLDRRGGTGCVRTRAACAAGAVCVGECGAGAAYRECVSSYTHAYGGDGRRKSDGRCCGGSALRMS